MVATPAHGPRRAAGLRLGCLLVQGFLLSFLGWLAAAVLVPLQPRTGRLAARVASLWARAMLVVAGTELVVEGAQRLRPSEARMLVANHASFLDPLVMLAVFPGPLRFVLKRELGRMPFVGWHARWAGHFLLERGDPRAGQRMVEEAARRAALRRLSPLVFPEGTRSADGRLGPLKSGTFQLAIEGGLPVQPVAILGTHAIWPRQSPGPVRPGRIVVRVGEPILAEGPAGQASAVRKDLATRARRALAALGVPTAAPKGAAGD